MEAVLCIGGDLATSLASTSWMSVALPMPVVTINMFTSIAKCPLGQNLFWLRTIALESLEERGRFGEIRGSKLLRSQPLKRDRQTKFGRFLEFWSLSLDRDVFCFFFFFFKILFIF